MSKQIEKLIELVEELKSDLTCQYFLYDQKDVKDGSLKAGTVKDTVRLPSKPQRGEIIHVSENQIFLVMDVHLSRTGFTGALIGHFRDYEGFSFGDQ